MSFKRMKGILALFWLVASIVIVVLDINGVINLARNNVLFFGVILSMFVSYTSLAERIARLAESNGVGAYEGKKKQK